MSYLAQQYAEGLFSLAIEENKIKSTVNDFTLFVDAIDDDIFAFLNHPKVKNDSKKEILSKAIQNTLLQHFIFVLIDNGRIELLKDILQEFIKIDDNQNKIMKVRVYSKFALSGQEKAQFIENLEQKHNRTIELENIVDEDIVGGLRYEYEGMVHDQTINNYLHNLKANLIK